MPDEHLPVASQATPNETDYETIRAAVTGSERGRWFLAEFARRNRHADTEAVLAAIARIEAALAASHGQSPRLRNDIAAVVQAISAPAGEPAAGGEVAAVNGAIDRSTSELGSIVAFTESATSDILAAAERIQEIAWTLREQGIDAAACDELDARATEIYQACSFQDLTGQRTDRVIEQLRHPEEPEDTTPRLDQAAVDRVLPVRAAPPEPPAVAAPPEPVAAEPPAVVAAPAAPLDPGGGVNTDALLADLLSMIRRARQPDAKAEEPKTETKPEAKPEPPKAEGDWNKPLARPEIESDIDWGEKPAEPTKQAAVETAPPPPATSEPPAALSEPAPTLIDEDDLLMPMPMSWTPTERAVATVEVTAEVAVQVVTREVAGAPPQIEDAPQALEAPVQAAEPVKAEEPPRSEPTQPAAESKPVAEPAAPMPVPLAATAAALTGQSLPAVADAPPSAAAPAEPASERAPNAQALAAVAALATLSDAEKIALFS